MNKYALYHKSDSLYGYAVDSRTVELRLRAARGDLADVSVIYGSKHAFYKYRSVVSMRLAASDGLFDYFTVKLKLSDTRLAYIFLLTDADGNKYYYSEDGATESYDFSVAFYNFFQLAYINKNDVMPCVDWLSRAVVYQIFVDRFKRSGKTEHRHGINMEWGGKPTPKSFAGGDLWGIAEELDRIADLGVDTLYLTPIFTSLSNHKYDISDYYNVDPDFGGNEAFENLMSECKKRGMRVILDAVFNHCSEHLREFRDVCEKGAASPYRDWFIINGDKPTKRPLNYEVFAECDYMPKWNTSNAQVQKYLCDVGEYWIKNYGIDGWRLDVSDEVSHDFWRVFRKRIKALGSDIVLIGENWHDSRSYLRGDQFDSIMNYAFTKAMLDYFAYGKLTTEELCFRLNELTMRNSEQVNLMMLNLLDCHDTHRFYTMCGADKEKLLCALAIEVFMPGASMVYYGTEIPLEGGYDPDNRRCFIPGDGEFAKKVKEVLKYKKLRALQEGSVSFSCENGLFVAERRAVGQTVTLLVNNTENALSSRGKNVAAKSYAVIAE